MQLEHQLPQETPLEAEPGGKWQGSQRAGMAQWAGLPLETMWSKWLMAPKGKLGLEEKGDLLEILQLVG